MYVYIHTHEEGRIDDTKCKKGLLSGGVSVNKLDNKQITQM